MTGLSLALGFLLFCSVFRCREGVGNEECPEPDPTKFGGYYTDRYVVGTWARYCCDEHYQREAGKSNIIRCRNVSGVIQWTYKDQPACVGLSPTEKWENSSIGPQVSHSTPKAIEGFCGVPVPLKHATVQVIKYKVGQNLTLKCLNESQAWPPITGTITCESSNGVAAWSSLNPQCPGDIPLDSGKQGLNPVILFIMAAGTTVFIL